MKRNNRETNRTLVEFWIGMTDMEEEGVFKWRSNRTLSPDVALYWGWPEPNNEGEKNEPENCVEVAGSGPYINDVDCNTKRASMCQKRGAGTENSLDQCFCLGISIS